MFLFAMTVATSAVSCGSPEADLCNQQCECEGCSEGQRNACVDDYNSDLKSAGFRGCVDLYDDWINCEQSLGACVGTDWKASCGDERDRLDHCIKK